MRHGLLKRVGAAQAAGGPQRTEPRRRGRRGDDPRLLLWLLVLAGGSSGRDARPAARAGRGREVRSWPGQRPRAAVAGAPRRPAEAAAEAGGVEAALPAGEGRPVLRQSAGAGPRAGPRTRRGAGLLAHVELILFSKGKI